MHQPTCRAPQGNLCRPRHDSSKLSNSDQTRSTQRHSIEKNMHREVQAFSRMLRGNGVTVRNNRHGSLAGRITDELRIAGPSLR